MMLYPYRGYSRFACVFFVLFIFAVLLGVGYSAHRERTAQLTFQLQRAQGSVLMVEDQITQTFQLIESMVMTLPELSDTSLAHTSSSELTRLLTRLQLGQPAVRSLSVMTAQSVIKASTNSANVGMVVSLDDYVPPDIDTAGVSVLRMGSIWVGRDFADGTMVVHDALPDQKARSFLPLAFRIGIGADAMWVLVAINTDYLLDRMVRYTQIDSDQFALIRFDGHLLMHSVDDRVSLGFSWMDMLPEMRVREIGTHAGQPLTAYRASSRYPFFFAIHVDQDATLAQWTANFWVVVYWTGAALLAVMVVTLLLMRQIRMSEEAQRQQQVELTLSRDRAEAATLAKSQFLASMSHEIRTPMNGVLGMTELLANSGLTGEQSELLRVLQSSGRTLLTLIDDILDFSKIEMGKLELEKIPFDIQLLLIDLKDTFVIQAEAKGLELILLPTQHLPRLLKGDPTRLRQVFSNLIANAIKFTHEGHVSISVQCSEASDEYEVCIQDTGIGISADVQKRLFTAFTQANSSITREYGGTGLGLAISAMLVHLMGGAYLVRK